MISNEPAWRTSTFSSDDTCVEVADVCSGHVLVRDTKDRTRRPVRFTPAAWQAFVDDVKTGRFE